MSLSPSSASDKPVSAPLATAAPPRQPQPTAARYVVLTGNPNCGKTTLFNALTGLRAKVGNYAGVTVERKEGKLQGAPADSNIRVLDLPGTYSLSPQSLDEQISRDVLLNRLPELPPASLIVVVLDASNLQRNLYYATQVIELGHPTIIALNMIDVAQANGHEIDAAKLSDLLRVPVAPIIASTGQGVPALRKAIQQKLDTSASPGTPKPKPQPFYQLPAAFQTEAEATAALLAETFHERRAQARAEALLILSNEKALASSLEHYPANIQEAVSGARQRLERAGIDWRSAAIEARYASISSIQRAVTTEVAAASETFSDRLDRVLTHKVWGTLIFIAVMALMFQSIFTFARIPMDAIQTGVDWLGSIVARIIPPGDLNSLLVDGVIAGVGAVVVFLPQILLLFLFIGFLEDTGYMARAAFLMDRLMSKVGLHGKSFIPMLSSFACAIPGIMATRTIESPKDRLVTILVSPLMSCSARLPVYTLLIGACIPNITVLGFLKLNGLTMLAMYLLGIIVALFMAWLFKKTLLKAETPLLIMELPPYKRPLLRVVARHMWDRSKIFLRRAGTVILGINILLWFLATYPRSSQIEKDFAARRAAQTQTSPEQKTALDNEEAGAKLRHSFAGHMGRFIEPVIKPLGFDWKMGIGIISSFAAREVFVSTMSTVYNVGKAEKTESSMKSLAKTLQAQRRPDGSLIYTPLVAITLMVFYVFALQCVSTVAIVRRETNSWKWPLFQWLYMGALAWGLAFLTYQGGRLLERHRNGDHVRSAFKRVLPKDKLHPQEEKRITKLLPLALPTNSISVRSAPAEQDSFGQPYNAITYEDVPKAKAALAAGIDWANDGRTDHQYSALHFAVGHTTSNGVEILKLVLATKADVNARAEYRQTPLHFAAHSGNTVASRLLIEHKADVNAVPRDRKTPLHLAASKGHIEIVKMLIENKADVKASDLYKNTPLMCAVVAKQRETETFLRQHGARE